MELTGKFVFILHSHIPYVLRHGAWPHGEHWLYEAAAETYMPLLGVLERLQRGGIRPGITIGLTPVLVEQLASDIFRKGFVDYLQTNIRLADRDEDRFRQAGDPQMARLARYWRKFYEDTLETFEVAYDGNLVSRFRMLQDQGAIEVMTSAATHGYLPLLATDACVAGQIRTGVHTHERFFGRAPASVWMPECAYRPEGFWQNPVMPELSRWRHGVDHFLVAEGLQCTVVDSSLLGNASLLDPYNGSQMAEPDMAHDVRSSYQPYRLGTGLGVLVRDHLTGFQVWSRYQGYPGDPAYLEFHKKKDTSGIQYWRITGANVDLGDKEVYDPDVARERVHAHAAHFVSLVTRVMAEHRQRAGRCGVLVAPFDAELFGHWWFEGSHWLYHVLKGLAEKGQVSAITASDACVCDDAELVSLPEGSWGENGDHSVWLNEQTRWTWQMLYPLEERFTGWVSGRDPNEIPAPVTELLRDAARALLVAEASDWQFLIHSGSGDDYAQERFRKHTGEVRRLLDLADHVWGGGTLSEADRAWLTEFRRDLVVFPNVSLSWWQNG